MRKFPGILLQMDATNPYLFYACFRFDLDSPIRGEWLIVLRDLVALGEVRVEVIFACENTFGVDFAIERQPDSDRQLDGFFVENRERARLTCANRTDIMIRFRCDRIDNFTS